MKFDAISNDPLLDEKFPPYTKTFTFKVKGDKLIAMVYVAQGEGPHPTVILYHGFPGHEKNIDLAQTLRRAGYNVMIFHYRGCWSSQGAYSISNVLEDAEAAINAIKSEDCVSSCRVDPSQIILMGYSLGGFAALITIANHPEIKSMAFMVGYNFGRYAKGLFGDEIKIRKAEEFWADCFAPLSGITQEQFIEELIENREKWDLVNHAMKLKDKKLLFVCGEYDRVADMENHNDPIVQILKNINSISLSEVILKTDHDCSNMRIKLAESLLEWLENSESMSISI
jgi:hypothetical protein